MALTFTARTALGTGFEELENSPKIRISRQSGLEATRVFRVDYADWEKFVGEIYGVYRSVSGTLAYTKPITFPGENPYILADDVSIEPFDGSNPDGTNILSLSTGLPTYSNGAQITVNYKQNVSSGQNDDNSVTVPEGTYYSYEADDAVEMLTVPGNYWRWNSDSKVIATEVSPAIQVPVTHHRVTWHNVLRPPYTTIKACRGHTNSATFVGCAAGTLLLIGTKLRNKFQFSTRDVLWEVEYTFAEKDQKGDGTTGWNYFFRYDTGAWALIEAAKGANAKPFPSATFANLFVMS